MASRSGQRGRIVGMPPARNAVAVDGEKSGKSTSLIGGLIAHLAVSLVMGAAAAALLGMVSVLVSGCSGQVGRSKLFYDTGRNTAWEQRRTFWATEVTACRVDLGLRSDGQTVASMPAWASTAANIPANVSCRSVEAFGPGVPILYRIFDQMQDGSSVSRYSLDITTSRRMYFVPVGIVPVGLATWSLLLSALIFSASIAKCPGGLCGRRRSCQPGLAGDPQRGGGGGL